MMIAPTGKLSPTPACRARPGRSGRRPSPRSRRWQAVLARAFAADPMVVWPLVTDDDLPARIRAMFEIVDTAFAGEGWIYSAADGLGVMSLLPPGTVEREQEISIAIAPALAALTPDGGERYERFWAWIDSTLPSEPRWLLDQVAVEPAAQGRGIGGAMLRFAIERATRDGLPLVLETGVPGNVPLYERVRVPRRARGGRPGRRPAHLVHAPRVRAPRSSGASAWSAGSSRRPTPR